VTSQLNSLADVVAAKLRAARRAAALTGAGVSAESGLATFRSGPRALWRDHRPEDLATPQAFARDPRLVWEWYRERLQRAAGVEPNPGHYALAAMAQRVARFTVVTQNVDGLHERAGSPDVIELHGNVRRARCVRCDARVPAPLEGALPPTCACGAMLRPDIVWFGEALPEGVFEKAYEAVASADVLIVAGTSAVVHPAAGLAEVAKSAGGFIVEVNPEETPATGLCDVCVRAPSGTFLPLVVERI